jgi:sulfide:quinone oxidoreductase
MQADLHLAAVAGFDTKQRRIALEGGGTVRYDAAIVAVGATRREWLDGAISFGGAADVDAFTGLLEGLEQDAVSRVAFTSPDGMTWTLPLYELALLTASRLAERGVAGVELTVITPEVEPLRLFGRAASAMLRGQLLDRGIQLRTATTADRFSDGRLELSNGEALVVDEVVALACLEGPRIPGLPCNRDGFIPIDEHCRVVGVQDVYAAGDGTAFPIKQGGLAAQQADVAVESIAAGLGAWVQPSTFEPSLRGLLLTGLAPLYLHAAVGDPLDDTGEVAADPLWWPPAKIAGRYLAPYLAHASTPGGRGQLEDRPTTSRGISAQRESHREAHQLALAFAMADADHGDYESALSWLEVIERIDGVLPVGFLEMREEWSAGAARSADRR